MTRILMIQPGQGALTTLRDDKEATLQRVGSPKDLADQLGKSPVKAVVLNAEGAEQDWNTQVDAILREAQVPVVWIGDHVTRPALLEVFRRPYVRHLLPRGASLRKDLACVLRALAADSSVPAQAFMKEGSAWVERKVTGSREKDTHLEAIWDYMVSVKIHRRIARAVQLVADEFLVNAVYNAPIDEHGEPMFRSWARTQEVILPRSGHATMRYACDGKRLILEVRDPYGSLREETLRHNLRRALEAGHDQIDQKAGGAGLGLYYIVSSATRMMVRVSPGKETVFTGVFHLDGGYKDFVRAPRAFHFFPV